MHIRHQCKWLHRSVWLALLLGASAAGADSSVSLGTAGALQRAGQTHDALKNGTAASFGSPVTDDRRLFKLRWRMPWLVASGASLAPAPFAPGFRATSFALPGGLALAAEPTQGLSALIPTIAVGEPRKLGQVQLGVISGTVGHGTIVERFTNSPDGVSRTPGMLLEGNLAGLGAQFMVGDVFRPHAFSATRIHGRPIMWFTAPDATFQPNELDLDPRTELAGIWVIGLSAVIDGEAPSLGGIDGSQVRRAWALGIDNEAALLDNQLVKTIGYLDVNALGTDGDAGFGLHPGALFMLDAVGFRMDALAEMNFGGEGYVPRYFDRLYMLERSTALGADKPKLDLDRPASWGYQLRVSGGFMEMVTGFIEARDQLPFDPTRGSGSGQITVGASTFLMFFGGSLTASQTGITDYANPNFGGRGFVVTAEGRVALIANTIHLVGRMWRAHLPAGDSPDDYIVSAGTALGVELNLDFL